MLQALQRMFQKYFLSFVQASISGSVKKSPDFKRCLNFPCSILTGIYENVGDHLEDSGSAPLKKVRAGEVAIGFGLRQQAVADKADGLPIDYIDPAEGNFSLTESIAIVDKGDDTNPLAMEMAQCIIENGREELQSYYPNAIYNGENTDAANKSANPKVFPEKLTVDLLEQHQAISEAAKEAAGI